MGFQDSALSWLGVLRAAGDAQAPQSVSFPCLGRNTAGATQFRPELVACIDRLPPHPVIVTIRDSSNSIRVLSYSFYAEADCNHASHKPCCFTAHVGAIDSLVELRALPQQRLVIRKRGVIIGRGCIGII